MKRTILINREGTLTDLYGPLTKQMFPGKPVKVRDLYDIPGLKCLITELIQYLSWNHTAI